MPLSRLFRVLSVWCCLMSLGADAATPTREQVLDVMKRATTFMVEKVSHHGGYVWTYLPDFSRRWGELEARPTMVWIQSGTPSMGNVFLDAWHATGDEYYYLAAAAVGDALIATQHSSGGWNYLADLAGEDSLREWYATVGRNAWRLEEFQHYCGNATFDDSTTPDAASFMLRLFLEKREDRFKASLDRATQFVLESQYPMGGWPQRFPHVGGGSPDGCPKYVRYITLNDRVGPENVEFLMACYGTLGRERFLDPIRRGMEAFILLQQPAPQAGWALQYTPDDLAPAGARSYEPAALATHATAACIEEMMTFYEKTGDPRFLERLPEAFAWLDSVRLPAAEGDQRGTHPTFVEVGTNEPLFLHRSGSNAVNGRYFVDKHPGRPLGHYSSERNIDVQKLRARYDRLRKHPVEPAPVGSLFREGAIPRELPKYMGGRGPVFSARFGSGFNAQRVGRILESLNDEGYWPTPLRFTSNPCAGDGPVTPVAGEYGSTFVGDHTDTSPYRADDPAIGISITSYMGNMSALIRYLESESKH